jgi:hypothetical protein
VTDIPKTLMGYPVKVVENENRGKCSFCGRKSTGGYFGEGFNFASCDHHGDELNAAMTEYLQTDQKES